MAMLAEPRQRKRYNLVPKGKALYEDDARFGTKMLEKMGWSKGKGLGAKEDGSQDFVRVRYKNDAQGLGYEQRDDQWTQHEDSFNGLLKTLNGEEDTENVADSKMSAQQSNDSGDDMPRVGFGFQDPAMEDSKKKNEKTKKLKEKISGISLEERSKQSKARVHYKKFTKGKDLAQYSEKDLANIFGKKVVDEQQQAVNDYYEQLNKSFGKTEEQKSEEDATNKLSGVQIISSGVSVADYFKKKMEEMKNRRNGKNNKVNTIEEDTTAKVQEEEVSKKKKKMKKAKQDQEKEPQTEKIDEPTDKYASKQIINTGVSVADYFKKKMEEKKNRQNGLIENNLYEQISVEIPVDEVTKKMKKEYMDKEEVAQNMNGMEGEVSTKTKKSKKRDAELVVDNLMEDNVKTISKKDKSKKKKEKKGDCKQQPNDLEITLDEQPATKKIKNETTGENRDDVSQVYNSEIDLTQEPEKKKSKKNKLQDLSEIIETDDTQKEIDTTIIDKTNSIEKSKKRDAKLVEDTLMEDNVEKISKKDKSKKKEKKIDHKQQPNELEIILDEQPKTKKRKNETTEENLNDNPEIDLTQEPEKKKKKKNISQDLSEIIEIDDTQKEIDTPIMDKTNSIEKSKKRDAKLVEDTLMEDNVETISKEDKSKKKEKKIDHKQQSNELEIILDEQPKTKKRKNETTEENLNDNPEIDLTQEPEKKKNNKNISKDSTEIIEIDDTQTELDTTLEDKTNPIEKKQKKKTKNKQESNKSSTMEEKSPTNINKKSEKSKTKDVSNEALTLDDLKTKYQSYNIYKISSFCAEKFRNIDLNHFTGSALPQVDGYGLTQNIQLEVEINKNDEERITNLWKNTLDKYSQLEKPKKTYNHYVKEVIKARKKKQKRPKLYVKTWKRKNAFQII